MTLTPEDRIRIARQFVSDPKIHIDTKLRQVREDRQAASRRYKIKHRERVRAQRKEAYAKKRALKDTVPKSLKEKQERIRHVSPGSIKDASWNGKVHTCCQSHSAFRHRLSCPLNSEDLSDLK